MSLLRSWCARLAEAQEEVVRFDWGTRMIGSSSAVETSRSERECRWFDPILPNEWAASITVMHWSLKSVIRVRLSGGPPRIHRLGRQADFYSVGVGSNPAGCTIEVRVRSGRLRLDRSMAGCNSQDLDEKRSPGWPAMRTRVANDEALRRRVGPEYCGRRKVRRNIASVPEGVRFSSPARECRRSVTVARLASTQLVRVRVSSPAQLPAQHDGRVPVS
jgi:hypothetical protein